MSITSYVQSELTTDDWEQLLQSTPYEYLQKIVDGLKNKNRFFVDPCIQKLLYSCTLTRADMRHFEEIVSEERTVYRSRIYRKPDALERLKDSNSFRPFQGYNAADSFVPPEGKYVDQGRANPENIRYLYTASDAMTSILEIRPHTGEYVSVATISVKEKAKIFDISKPFSPLYNYGKEREKWRAEFFLYLMKRFQKPYIETGDYYLCQYVSEYIKLLGFDGIKFRSAMNSEDYSPVRGINYTFFRYSKCEVVSSALYEIAATRVTTRPSFLCDSAKTDLDEELAVETE